VVKKKKFLRGVFLFDKHAVPLACDVFMLLATCGWYGPPGIRYRAGHFGKREPGTENANHTQPLAINPNYITHHLFN
jgi:hypothetical protein